MADLFYREEGFETPADQIRDHAAKLIAKAAALVLVAEIDNTPIGFAITATSGLEQGLIAELEDLYVLEDARRRGVARRLIDRSRAWAAGEGCTELEVVIDREGEARHGLAAFYTKLGFVDHRRRLLSQPLTSSHASPKSSDHGDVAK